MKTLFSILAIATLPLLSSCDLFNLKHDPKLPPITTDGNDTFGCLVNGNLFLPEAPFGYGAGVYAELQGSADTVGVNIYATNTTAHKNLLIAVFDTPTLKIGKKYDLSDKIFFVQYIDPRNSSSCTYQNVISGSIELLKFDVSNPNKKIIAGTFQFNLSSVGCKDTINITEGRFDISDFQ